MYERHLLGWKIEYLHRVNIGDVDGLRSELQDWMVWDGFAIWQFLQKGQLTPKEQEQAYGQLRLMAIQYEKYPVAKWKDWHFWTLDLGGLTSEGTFVIECATGQGAVRSFPFQVRSHLLERETNRVPPLGAQAPQHER